jgi:hypothetical protein
MTLHGYGIFGYIFVFRLPRFRPRVILADKIGKRRPGEEMARERK